MGVSAILGVESVSKRFGGVHALAEVSLGLQSGEVHALIGPNGAGKSTLLDIICGFTPASAGRVRFRGQDVTGWTPHRIARAGVARTFQTPSLFPALTVAENVLVGLAQTQHLPLWATLRHGGRAAAGSGRLAAQVPEYLDLVGLGGRAEVEAPKLPYGQRRLLEIARALATSPTVLLLDEPAAGLNDDEVEALRPLLEEIARRGTAVLLIEHNVRLVTQVAAHVTVLNFGRLIFAGTPAEALRDPAVLTAYLGEEGERIVPLP